MSSSVETKTEWVVLGKLGDHCKKMVELEFLAQAEPHLSRSIELQFNAISEVVKNWPLNSANDFSLPYVIHELRTYMRGMKHWEQAMYDIAGREDSNKQELVLAISQFKAHKDNARKTLSTLNTMGENS